MSWSSGQRQRKRTCCQTSKAAQEAGGAGTSSRTENDALVADGPSDSARVQEKERVLHDISFKLRPGTVLGLLGRTGSGKTTTLYAAMERLNNKRRNIMTVEDPIEYFIDGIGQTQVNTKADMTFARGLRSILENSMLDVMFDIPSQDRVKEVVINEDVIGKGIKPIVLYDVAESA
mgnify:CR=1 FL=1